jgi:3-oxoacyl-[acyl-carrier protein] reductase
MTENHNMPTAVITGTSRGLGRALTERLLSLGWYVYGISRSSSRINHPHFQEYLVDITNEQAVQQVANSIKETGKSIEVLVNNAGAASMNAFLLTPFKSAESIMRLNYLSTFNTTQLFGKIMARQRHGLIVNITTVAVPLNLEGEAAYVASKAAVEALTRVTAREMIAQGVKVIALGFGPIDTDLTRAISRDKIQKINDQISRPSGTTLSEAIDFILEKINNSEIKSGSVEYLGDIR